MSDTLNPELFLLDQQLSRLSDAVPLQERKAHVCGSAFDKDAWLPIPRPDLCAQATSDRPPLRVGLVCDAGLGKTTNLQWFQAHLVERSSRQVPLLLRLEEREDRQLLVQERQSGQPSEALLNRLAKLIEDQARGDPRRHAVALRRLQAAGRITLLIDGLDHVRATPQMGKLLQEMLDSEQWRRCPVWISGRPSAFATCWKELFAKPGWQFLRVHELAEPEIRFYMSRCAGGDWYDEFPAETHNLLAIPRLLHLIGGILRNALAGVEGESARTAAVRALHLRTPADVYYWAFFHLGDEDDPDSHGLLAQGLQGTAERIGLGDEFKPQWNNRAKRVQRTAALLGAIAFQTFAMDSHTKQPQPRFSGVKLDPFQDHVAQRLQAAGQGTAAEFERDFGLLKDMNIHALDFLLFREADARQLVWHDRTMQAFFAAYWAMNFGTPEDGKNWDRWKAVVEDDGDGLTGFDEFWQFAAEMPDQLLRGTERWLDTFTPCYGLPKQLNGKPGQEIQWCRRMIYHSFARMQERSGETIVQWRAPFAALAQGTAKQKRIHREIEQGFRDIAAGSCLYGADPLEGQRGTPRDVKPFRMHQWPVTNEMYEEFDPRHKTIRWRGNSHPLAKKRGKGGEDRCPVVHLSWYDAWCFAAWCGHWLPTELEWEHACRAESVTAWYFGNDEAELKKHAWYGLDLKTGSTHPVGILLPNSNLLYDVHGNVWEWCEDRYEPGASRRVLRGGGWDDYGEHCRSAYRHSGAPDYRFRDYGFRLAAVSDEVKQVRHKQA
jgi:formylglycine-generating enzyme required for sulfatase activity